MSVSPEVLAVVRQWIERAEHDLTNAEHTLTLMQNCPYDTACFHSQQCSEKYLKALLAFHRIDFPRTHDLTELFALIPAGARPAILTTELAELTPYAVEARYPGDWDPQTRADAARAIECALSIRAAVRTCLPAGVDNLGPA